MSFELSALKVGDFLISTALSPDSTIRRNNIFLVLKGRIHLCVEFAILDQRFILF